MLLEQFQYLNSFIYLVHRQPNHHHLYLRSHLDRLPEGKNFLFILLSNFSLHCIFLAMGWCTCLFSRCSIFKHSATTPTFNLNLSPPIKCKRTQKSEGNANWCKKNSVNTPYHNITLTSELSLLFQKKRWCCWKSEWEQVRHEDFYPASDTKHQYVLSRNPKTGGLL